VRRGIAVIGLLLLGGLLLAPEPAGATYRYDRAGPYLDYASRPHTIHWPSLSGATRQIDSQGILLTETTGEQTRSAVEDAVYGLVEWSKYERGGPRKYLARAKRATVWLAQKQDQAGLFHYDYEYDLGGPQRPLVLHRGWYGALAQGVTASLGSRLYRLTGKRFYLRLARRAIEPFSRMINQDGVQSRFLGTDNVFFEGYGTLPVAVHTLDHFMYSLVGLYDMADLSPVARGLFRRGLRTLSVALPYYDVVGPDGRPRSAPWLAQLTDPPRPAYTLQGFLQEQEVAILRALSSLRPKLKILRTYERRYLRQLSWICLSPAELCQFAH
jgi:hypothetical protein